MTIAAATTTNAATDPPTMASDPATTGLLGAAFQLPFEFALGRRTSLFVGRHRRCPFMVVGWVSKECAS